MTPRAASIIMATVCYLLALAGLLQLLFSVAQAVTGTNLWFPVGLFIGGLLFAGNAAGAGILTIAAIHRLGWAWFAAGSAIAAVPTAYVVLIVLGE